MGKPGVRNSKEIRIKIEAPNSTRGKYNSQSRRQILGRVFQRDHCQGPPVPTIKQSKHRESRDCNTGNIRYIRSLKTSGVAAPRILQQMQNQVLRCPHELLGNLRAPILDADSIAVVTDTPIKRRMNTKPGAHQQSPSSVSEIAQSSRSRQVQPRLLGPVPPATEELVETEPRIAAVRFATPAGRRRLCITPKSSFLR